MILNQRNWLCNTVIEAFLEIISKQTFPTRNVICIPSFLFHQINTYNIYNNFNHLFTLTNINNDIIFIIHIPNHWLLAIISKRTSMIFILDGLYRNQPYNDIYHKLLEWYKQLCAFLNIPFKAQSWSKKTFMDYTQLPVQTDGYSCGVLSCFLAMYYIKNELYQLIMIIMNIK